RLRANPQDAAAASGILGEAKEAASWSAQLLLESACAPETVAFLSERAGVAGGVIIGRHITDEGEILNLAVAVRCRRQGEGRALLGTLLATFSEKGVTRVFLEVRESNAGAIAFYKTFGFQPIATRKDYYQEPVEAAVVMELVLERTG